MRERVGSNPTTLKNENHKREENKGRIYRRGDRENSEYNGANSNRGNKGKKTKMISKYMSRNGTSTRSSTREGNITNGI